MARKVVTLYIDDTNIRLLEARGKRVHKWARLPLDPGLVRDGAIADEEQVASKLTELLELTRVTARRVTVGLSGLSSLYRLISIPELPEAVREEAVKHEARRVIPVSLDQVYYSYQPLPAPRGETRLYLVAFPRNTADTLIRTLRRVGLEPNVMDLAPLALARTINEPRAIIVNAWSTNVDIVVMIERVPEVIRSLSLPSEATAISEALPAITEELERTITFYNSSHLENPLTSSVPILVSGDLAEAPETWPSLVGQSDYSVSLLPPPMDFPEGFNPSQFMVNVGLALKELLPEKADSNVSLVNFNALPEVRPAKPMRLSSILMPIGVLIGIGLVLYAGFQLQITTAQTTTIRSKLGPVESSIAQHQHAIANLKEKIGQVEVQIGPVEAKGAILSSTFDSLAKMQEKVNADLHAIADLVPAEVAMIHAGDKVAEFTARTSDSGIVHGIEQATVREGWASNVPEIFEYARALRSSGRFSEVIISSIEASQYTIGDEEEEEEIEIIQGYNFTILLR